MRRKQKVASMSGSTRPGSARWLWLSVWICECARSLYTHLIHLIGVRIWSTDSEIKRQSLDPIFGRLAHFDYVQHMILFSVDNSNAVYSFWNILSTFYSKMDLIEVQATNSNVYTLLRCISYTFYTSYFFRSLHFLFRPIRSIRSDPIPI